MGYNTTLFIVNDVQNYVDADPEGWWKEVKRHQLEAVREPQEFGFSNAANGFWVASNQHADQVKVLFVGGNYVSVLGTVYNGNRGHHELPDRVRILGEMLDPLDLRIRIKRPR